MAGVLLSHSYQRQGSHLSVGECAKVCGGISG